MHHDLSYPQTPNSGSNFLDVAPTKPLWIPVSKIRRGEADYNTPCSHQGILPTPYTPGGREPEILRRQPEIEHHWAPCWEVDADACWQICLPWLPPPSPPRLKAVLVRWAINAEEEGESPFPFDSGSAICTSSSTSVAHVSKPGRSHVLSRKRHTIH